MGKTVKHKQQTRHMPQLNINKQEHTWKTTDHKQNTTPKQFKTNKHNEQHMWNTEPGKYRQQHQITFKLNKQTKHM